MTENKTKSFRKAEDVYKVQIVLSTAKTVCGGVSKHAAQFSHYQLSLNQYSTHFSDIYSFNTPNKYNAMKCPRKQSHEM